MTPSEIRRLAVEVMGWEPFGQIFKIDGKSMTWTAYFNPFSNLSDAFMVAEKIGDLVLTHNKASGYWYAHFNRADGDRYENLTRNGRKPEQAIAEAALAWLSAREGK